MPNLSLATHDDEPEPIEPATPAAEPDAAPVVDEPSPDAKTLSRIIALNQTIKDRKDDYRNAKEVASDARKAVESAQLDLEMFITSNEFPLLDNAPSRFPSDGSEAWRSTPVSILTSAHGLAAPVMLKLEQSGLDTLGKLADWTTDRKDFTDIPGVGETKAEMIRNALDGYWRDNPVDDRDDGDESDEELNGF